MIRAPISSTSAPLPPVKTPSDSLSLPSCRASVWLLLATGISACGSLQWDYKIPNGGDEGDAAQYQPDDPIPGLGAGEAVAFLRYSATGDFVGPFPTDVVEISIHDPRAGGKGATFQAQEAAFRVSGNDTSNPTAGYGRGGTFEGSGKGTWTHGGGQGASVIPQALVVQTRIDSPRVYRQGDEFDLLFECNNTGGRTIAEIVLVDYLDSRLLVSNPRGATVTRKDAGTRVRWQKSLRLAPGESTRFQLTCRVKPGKRNKKTLN